MIKLRIAHFPGALSGGVGSVVMNLYRNIDRNKVIFDFYLSSECSPELEKEIISYGGSVTLIPQIRKIGPIKYTNYIRKLLSTGTRYDAIHIHSVHMGALTVIGAKLAKISKIIYHVHSTQDPAIHGMHFEALVKMACKFFINRSVHYKIACGADAGKYIYGNHPFIILNNGVDSRKFKPQKIENTFRQNPDDIIVGHVGRFAEVKNHKFIIELAKADYKNKCRFLLIGDGPLFSDIKNETIKTGVYNKFIFLGQRKDLEFLYNCMDVFILPSLFEGFPVSVVEAQACGLPCITSEFVTKDADLSINAFELLPLNPQQWIHQIYASRNSKNNNIEVIKEKIQEKRFSIKNIANYLLGFYQK